MPYQSSGKRADLAVYIPQRDPKTWEAVIEIKFANSEKGWNSFEDDARKVLQSNYDRKFLLVFPVRVWPGESDGSTACPSISDVHLKHLDERLKTVSERGSVKLVGEEKVDTWRVEGDEIPSGLALFEVETARKSRAAGAGS